MYVYQKSASHIIAYFALEFPDRGCSEAKKKTILAACKRVWNPTRHPQLPQLPAPPIPATSLESAWNPIRSPTTARVWKPNLAQTSGKVPNPTGLRPAHSQMPLTSPISHLCLPKLLLRAIRCGVDIVVAQGSKTRHLLPTVYTNILGRLLFVWF